MNARTCQLCGKSLSRLRGSSDGDFCSREHRSQYRLRLGMDRLEEANKVSSLMRRRENPRQLGSDRLMRNAASAARVFESPKLLAKQFETPAVPAALASALSIGGAARMANEPQGYRQARPARQPGAPAARRPDSPGIHIASRKKTPALSRRNVKLPAKLLQARIARLRMTPPQPNTRRHRFDRLPKHGIRVEPGWRPAILRGPGALGTVSLQRSPRARTLRMTARKGNALRVSSGTGFRVAKGHLRKHATAPAVRSALVWPQRLHSTTPRSVAWSNTRGNTRNNPESHNGPAAPKLLRVDIPVAGARRPAGPGPGRAPRFTQARLVVLAPCKARAGAQLPARLRAVEWNPANPEWAGMVPGPESAGFARRNGAHLVDLAMHANAISAVRQLASAPIRTEESPVGYPRVGIQGTLAGAILSPGNVPVAQGGLTLVKGGASGNGPEASTAPPPAPRVVRQFEDHFDNGWDNWTGGMADWLVNVAGARTGSLALYNPSMDLIDYDLDFLARIDHRSVSWVVRAANLNEYCRCTLTAVPGGELEFTRCVVFEGAAEPAIAEGRRIAAKPKSAMTVRTRVEGDTFAVLVDGTQVATWQDERLPIGGIGFVGAPDDRARLYWVRLSSSGSPAKEYQKR